MGKLVGKPLTVDEFSNNYWTYYLDLESQTASIRRYISFSKKNYSAFSVETLRLLQVICSEIDVFAKQIAIEFSDDGSISDHATIYSWGPPVYFTSPNICNKRAQIRNSECVVWPWKNWRYERAKTHQATKRRRCRRSILRAAEVHLGGMSITPSNTRELLLTAMEAITLKKQIFETCSRRSGLFSFLNRFTQPASILPNRSSQTCLLFNRLPESN